jgi:phosphatidylglycerol:prolipoprotein diacylglycerol transferase
MIPWFNIRFPSLGPLTIHAFGILVATGILVGARLTRNRGRELGLTDEKVASMITTTLVCGFLFSHIFDVFAYQTAGPSPTLWQIINPFGGLSSYGGFIGALGGLFYWCKKEKTPVMPYADSLAFGLATGWMFGRLGCFTAHDHPGRFTNFFLAVRYPEGARHDLGLDEAIWAFLVSMLFFYLSRLSRRPRPLGLYVTLLTLLYAPVRFGFDFLRAIDVQGADPRYFGLTPAQYGSLAVLVVGVGLAVWTRRHAAQEARA